MKDNKPDIRFEGFEEAWEEKQLKDLVNYSSTGIRVCDCDNSGKYELYDANEVIGKINSYVSDASFISIIKDGSGVGRVRLMPGYTSCIGTMGCLTSKDDNDINFIFSQLQTKDFSKHIISGAIPHVYFRDYGEDSSNVPKPAEQEKVGEFFRNLDELIEAKEQELEKLRHIKLALLGKMFPSDEPDNANWGGYNRLINSGLLMRHNLEILPSRPNTPAIRFRGFTEPWELKSFRDFGYVSMCKRILKSQTSTKGDVPFFKIGTFGNIPDSFISYDLYSEYSQKYPFPRKGDILISAAGTIGRVVEYDGQKAYFQDSNIVWLNHNDDLDNSFLKILYSIVHWNGLEGSTLKRLYNNNLLDTTFYIPSPNEQKKIGEFFKEQDDNIANAQLQIIKLRNIKQALMEKMFA